METIPRAYVAAERRLVSEWANHAYPRTVKMFNLRVGASQPTLADTGMTELAWRGTVGNLRRFVDCVVVLPDALLSVEAKVIAHPSAIGQLLLYAQLLPHTPELADLAQLPVRSVLLCAIEDPAVSLMARQNNVEVVVFEPDWIKPYLETKAHRNRVPPVVDGGIAGAVEGTP